MDVKDVVTTIVAITVGVLLIGTLLVPQAQTVINTMIEKDQEGWASLVSVVVVVSIISLVVIALYAYK